MSFNLEIDSYNNEELLELLSIKKPYSKNDVDENCQRIKTKLLDDYSQSAGVKRNIETFLDEVKQKLTNNSIDVSVLVPEDYNIQKFTPTHPTSTPPKKINPIKQRLIKKALNIDTRFRNNYYITDSTDLFLNLPTSIKNTINMRLTSLELPINAIYIINQKQGNNFFHIGYLGEWHKIVIGDGNYNIVEMIAALNQSILSSSLINGVVVVEQKIPTKQIYFKSSSPIKIAFNRTNDNFLEPNTVYQLKLGWILGFTQHTAGENSEYISDNNGCIVGEAPYNGEDTQYLFLAIDDYNNNVNDHFISAFNESILQKNIIAKITLPKKKVGGTFVMLENGEQLSCIERT